MSIHTLMFGWEFPPLSLGGLGVACQGLVKGLLQNNVKVTLVLPHAHGTADAVEIRYPTTKTLHTVRVESALQPYMGAAEYQTHIRAMPKHMSSIYGSDMAAAIQNFTDASVDMTKDLHPDVVHCHDWMTYEAGARAAAHHRKPLVAHIHATELDRTYFAPHQWIYDRERNGLERADRIIAVSNYTKNILTKHYGIRPEKIAVVHNGSHAEEVQTQRLVSSAAKPRPPLVLFLGRMTVQKGPRQFIDMAKLVHHARPDARFVMAGDGHMLGELMEYSCLRGVQDAMIFAGAVNSREAAQLYAQADCFVMPSLSEPFGLVALEAIAHGTPVILSRQSGASEVIGHCMKVDFWDTEKMADCVLTILREDALAEQLRSEAPAILRHLTWGNKAREVRAVYHDVIHSKHYTHP